jgi:biopolymer transport protein ExbB
MHVMMRSIVPIALAALLASATAALAQAPPPAPVEQNTPPADNAPPQPVALTPPAMSPLPPATEMIQNPYGFSALWNGGDFVARGTLVILLIMSMGSWYVIVTKLIEQMVLSRHAGDAEREFWKAASIADGAEKLARRSAFRMMIEDGMRATQSREGMLTEQIDVQSWITLSLQRSADSIGNRMQRGMALLATVGSTAPFVGLFGTVWGIYHALTEIGIAGQASIDKVAGPVGEALIMTAMGLAVAVPAVLGYNWLIRRNKVVLDRVRSFAADLMALLTGAARPTARPAVRSA